MGHYLSHLYIYYDVLLGDKTVATQCFFDGLVTIVLLGNQVIFVRAYNVIWFLASYQPYSLCADTSSICISLQYSNRFSRYLRRLRSRLFWPKSCQYLSLAKRVICCPRSHAMDPSEYLTLYLSCPPIRLCAKTPSIGYCPYSPPRTLRSILPKQWGTA